MAEPARTNPDLLHAADPPLPFPGFGDAALGEVTGTEHECMGGLPVLETFCSTCGPLDEPGVHSQRDCLRYLGPRDLPGEGCER